MPIEIIAAIALLCGSGNTGTFTRDVCQVDLIQCVKTTTLNWTEQNDHGYGYGKVLAECVLDRGKRK